MIAKKNRYFNEKTSINNNYWKLPKSQNKNLDLYLNQKYNFPSSLLPILNRWGIHKDNFELFLDGKLKDFLPDPNILDDMEKTVIRLADEIENKNPIGVFGDYDVDGATSAAMLKYFFQYFGNVVNIHIPDRFTEGYGPNLLALNQLIKKGAKLIITVDCGISSVEQLKGLEKTAIDIIVIDHHEPGKELPPAYSIINPKNKNNKSGLDYLCAAGVTFIVLIGLNRELRQRGIYKKIKEPNLLKLLDLVALGTVCDVVPLVGLNRVLVKNGLKVLSSRKNYGIKALCDISNLSSVPDEKSLGFILGPKINAGGRIGSSTLGVDLLTSVNPTQAVEIAFRLNELNEKRKTMTNLAELEAIGMVEKEKMVNGKLPEFIFLVSDSWHEGIIGILAGKLKDRYNRPCCIISSKNGFCKGSARSNRNLSLDTLFFGALEQKILSKGGGHKLAAGLTIKKENINKFREYINLSVKSQSSEISSKFEINVTCELNVSALNYDLVKWINKLGPWGEGNNIPCFIIKNAFVKKIIYFGSNKQHLMFIISDYSGDILCKVFNIKNTPFLNFVEKGKNSPLNFLGNLLLNDWNNQNKLEFNLIDIMT